MRGGRSAATWPSYKRDESGGEDASRAAFHVSDERYRTMRGEIYKTRSGCVQEQHRRPIRWPIASRRRTLAVNHAPRRSGTDKVSRDPFANRFVYRTNRRQPVECKSYSIWNSYRAFPR